MSIQFEQKVKTLERIVAELEKRLTALENKPIETRPVISIKDKSWKTAS